MAIFRLLTDSLAKRFAIAAAALATATLLLISFSSWWLIREQHASAVHLLNHKEAEFHATTVSRMLHGIAWRLSEVANSSILATGLGRLRSKLKYRPVLFDLMPPTFTLSELQTAAEAVAGLSLHKQNFRRGVERTGLVEPTGRLSAATGGRPAELFRTVDGDLSAADALGLPLPAQR